MATAELEHAVHWGCLEAAEEQVACEIVKEVDSYCDSVPTVVVESSQISGSHISDAPVIFFTNDHVAEVEVNGEITDVHWSLPPDAEEEVEVPASSESGRNDVNLSDDVPEIPLNYETYATHHPFPCDFCSRRFKKKANLINHMVAHQTQRPHSCDICSSRFMRKCDLVNHKKIHTYVPNRDNRHDLDDVMTRYTQTTESRSRGRRRSTAPARKPPARRRSPDPSLSPTSSIEDRSSEMYKTTSYVDEDVKLLLEMTSKLRESRKTEGDINNTQLVTSPEPAKVTGTAEKPYVCSKCQRCFARESALVSHSQVHAEDSAYNCNKCGSRFFTIELLRDHYVKKHQSQYTGETSDDQEDNPKPDKGSYTGDERFGTFFCQICSISFHRQDLLKQHKKTLHTKDYEGLYRCGSCQNMYLTNEKLVEHLESNLGCQKDVCLLCGEHFTDQSAVQAHIRSRHGRGLPPNSCIYCGKQCRTAPAMKKHIYMAHLNDRRFTCRRVDCQKRFMSWGKLKRHMLSHDLSKSINCDDCDEEFPNRRSLLNHRHSHQAEMTSLRRFVCNECGKSFGSRSSQQIHNRIHTGERPYGCRYCWKAFADGGTLRKHERIHTGEKPYVCAVCPRAFNQRVVLREHIRSHHSAATNKSGYQAPVYACPVCNAFANNSEELALHLVKHSDENTLKNRVPTSGTRPYKRRRKTEYYEINNEFDEADFFDNNSETESVESDKPQARKSPSRGRKSNSTSNYAKLNKTMDAAISNLSSLVDPPVRKAKMISTKLQPNASKAGKKGAKKRGRRTVEVSSVTVVPKTRVRTLSGRLSGKWDGSSTSTETPEKEKKQSNMTIEEPRRMGRPRTKNVNYETLRSLNQGLPQATFPEMTNDVKKEDHSEDDKEKNLIIKEEMIGDVSEEDDEENEEQRVCGICHQVFLSKADLLFHVPVHI